MSEQAQGYDQRAEEYERKAMAVTDPWLKQRYLLLAKRCREMQKLRRTENVVRARARIA
jgi:hypothetical protein